jgi:hypothetical protein
MAATSQQTISGDNQLNNAKVVSEEALCANSLASFNHTQEAILGPLGMSQFQPSFPFFVPNEPYESFEFVPNSLQFFYPKQVQKQLQKKKFQNNERIVQGLRAATGKVALSKQLEKMRALT